MLTHPTAFSQMFTAYPTGRCVCNDYLEQLASVQPFVSTPRGNERLAAVLQLDEVTECEVRRRMLDRVTHTSDAAPPRI